MDPSGAVIVGAKITVVNSGTGASLETTSTSAGSYRFPELPLGTYDVTATANGFGTQVQHGVLVTIGSVSALNLTLAPGGESTTVNVDASAPAIETQSSDVGGTVDSRQIVELPLALGGVGALRSPEAFEFLLPGTTGPGTANSNNGIFLSKISGGQEYGNEVLLDGASQTRSENGSSFDEEAPSVEALQEFKITTAIPEAEYGRTTGGIESFVTKSGTKEFHGTAFDIFRNEAMDANTWFNNGNRALTCVGAAATPACAANFRTPSDKQNDYGGSFGGPVKIPKVFNGGDKYFFFFAWEQFQQKLGATQISTVPTLAERGGDFTDRYNPAAPAPTPSGTNPCDGTPVYTGEVFDPSTTRTVNGTPCRSPFPGNIVPVNRFSAVAGGLLNYIPAPTTTALFNNFFFPSTIPLTNTTYTVRVDANVSEASKIFVSYSTRDNNRTSGGNPLLPYPEDPNTWKQDFETHLGRAGWDYAIKPAVLNHLNFGFNRTNSKNFAYPIFNNIDYAQRLGIANAPPSLNFPQVTFDGRDDLVNLGNPGQNDDNVDNGWRVNDSVSIEKGRNSYKIGFDYRLQQYSPINNPSPAVNFARPQTSSDLGNSENDGNSFASLLLGQTSGGNFAAGLYAEKPRWTSYYYALFAQDDLKVNNNLTLNLGVRWDVDVPRTEAHNATSNFSPTAIDTEYGVPGAMVFGTTCHCNTRWANTYYKDIAPRIGFAYTPANSNGKTVFRGGGAIFYGPLQFSDFGGSMNQGYKIAPSFTSADEFSPAFQLDSGYPAYPQPPSLDPGLFNGQAVTGSFIAPSDGKPAAVYEWSLQMQQQLAEDLILSIGYLGNKAQNLRSNVQNINNIPIADFALSSQLNQSVTANTAGVTPPFPGFTTIWGANAPVQRALRPFPQYDYIDTGCCLQNVGMSTYNALLVSLTRRYRNGLTLQFSYTFAKNLTDADSALPNNGISVSQVQNPFDLRQDKAISAQDIRNTVVLAPLYRLPFGAGQPFLNHGFLSVVAGGWEIGSVQRYESGQPVSFCCATGIPGFENSIYYSRVFGQPLKSANYQSGHLNPLIPGQNNYFNKSAFFDPNAAASAPNSTAPWSFGDVPRVTDEVRTQAYLNEDISLLKTTPIKEGVSFVLKAEFLNALNRHQFALPGDLNPTDGNFGIPTTTISTPRNLQITGRITF
ncbi:Oar protein [Acidisarcina polymorpha]|uniref:Oar protein n=1 Tax=Acidisarcina polymorpha TaxID=2211140 RepID=A0A2Z5G1M8_9BACT|nr:Oar protein [Acidisarcina polymorpha]